jgi:hypothetical protein
MPALPPYTPTKEANFNLWLLNFSSLILANPSAYGLTAAAASTIAGEVATWSAAYAPITSKATKTPTAVSAKNTVRVTVTAQIRTYAQAISKSGVRGQGSGVRGQRSEVRGQNSNLRPLTSDF